MICKNYHFNISKSSILWIWNTNIPIVNYVTQNSSNVKIIGQKDILLLIMGFIGGFVISKINDLTNYESKT